MKSITVKENFGFGGKLHIRKMGLNFRSPVDGIRICTGAKDSSGYGVDLSVKRARKFFEAGLQMCDELEQEKK